MKKQSMSDLAVSMIKTDILSGKYKVGDKYLSENELCVKLDVSRTTVREAIRVLQALGYLELRAGKGAFVAATDESMLSRSAQNEIRFMGESFLELTEVRLGLEPIVAKYAAMRASDEDIVLLLGFLSLFELAYSNKNAIGMLDADEKFHIQIAKAAKNDIFLKLYRGMDVSMRECKSKLFSIDDNGRAAIDEHKAIATAISERNAERAYLAMKAHIENVSENIVELSRG